MKDLYQRELYLVCPHTATAVAGILSLKLPSQTTVCLATAHPAKFEEAVNLSLKNNKLPVPDLPEELRCLFSKPVKKTFLPKSLNEIKKFILSKVKKTSLFSTSWFRVGVEVGILTAAVIGVFLLIRKR
jgi:threonine synthase